nr:Uncharacterised protein [Klebsiella pneumoniae]
MNRIAERRHANHMKRGTGQHAEGEQFLTVCWANIARKTGNFPRTIRCELHRAYLSIANRRRIFRTPEAVAPGTVANEKKKRSVIDDNENGFIINTYDALQAILK